MSKHLRWGIIGAAKFAREHMGPAINAARNSTLNAIATREAAKAEPFKSLAPGLRVHTTYEALLVDPDIDAVYVPLPNSMHVEYALKAMDAGKHVLVEKPLALSADAFAPVIAKRDETGLLAAEAFMIVFHPQWHKARDILASGELGTLRHVDATFTYNNASDPNNIRNAAATGGGGMPDIGVYVIGGPRFATGQEPERITFAHIERENGVDVFTRAEAQFPGFTYSCMVSMRAALRQEVVFHGSDGVMRLTAPFNPLGYDQAEIVLERSSTQRDIIRMPGTNQYVRQVEAFADTVFNGVPYGCPLEFSRGTQAMMDAIFAKADEGV